MHENAAFRVLLPAVGARSYPRLAVEQVFSSHTQNQSQILESYTLEV